jgi:hypothetical protein
LSAAVVVLTQVWATSSTASNRPVTERKGTHRLHLVSASMEDQPAGQTSPQPEIAFYRKYTETILRRYMALSFGPGRVPSLLGRELFPGEVSHRKVQGFDDDVIFVHDVTKILSRLSPGRQHLVRRIALQGYTQAETAALLGIGLSTVVRRYWDAIDKLTASLMERKMLQPVPQPAPQASQRHPVENLSRGTGSGFEDNLLQMNNLEGEIF